MENVISGDFSDHNYFMPKFDNIDFKLVNLLYHLSFFEFLPTFKEENHKSKTPDYFLVGVIRNGYAKQKKQAESSLHSNGL